MSQAADGTPILGAPLGTLARRFLSFCMIDIVVPSAMHEQSSGRDL
jgi:hypothetical protein